MGLRRHPLATWWPTVMMTTRTVRLVLSWYARCNVEPDRMLNACGSGMWYESQWSLVEAKLTTRQGFRKDIQHQASSCKEDTMSVFTYRMSRKLLAAFWSFGSSKKSRRDENSKLEAWKPRLIAGARLSTCRQRGLLLAKIAF